MPILIIILIYLIVKAMITNKIDKDVAFQTTIEFIEENYKFDIEEIFDNIKRVANNGKFYLKYIITDESKVHSLEYYMKANHYMCSSNYKLLKDINNKVIYDENDIPMKSEIWLDIWWSLT